MRCILLLGSIHIVMRSEKLLKGEGIEVDLVPVPREVSSDCGVAIDVPLESRKTALALLEKGGISVLACFLKGNGRFEKG
jgi:hypothetical protein